MHLYYRNVNDAFRGLVSVFACSESALTIRRSKSRVGEVLVIDEPVTVTYTHPQERVLFNQARDANPFFHLFESLWMLAGRNDVEPLARYNSQIANIASDDGVVFNGAYGYRWRHSIDNNSDGNYEIDQLLHIIGQLKQNPNCRRCVLQIWNVEDDLLKVDDTKDVPCNTHVYFATNNGQLDMTVCNRSNDLVWGMVGANVVHFSVLQEYLATCIGVQVGVYNQFSSNLHVYTERFKPQEWLSDQTQFDYSAHDLFPLVRNPSTFNTEVTQFIDNHDWTRIWEEPFLNCVAAPMCWAFELHKRRQYRESLQTMDLVAADDWQYAARNWLLKRKRSWEDRNVSTSKL